MGVFSFTPNTKNRESTEKDLEVRCFEVGEGAPQSSPLLMMGKILNWYEAEVNVDFYLFFCMCAGGVELCQPLTP